MLNKLLFGLATLILLAPILSFSAEHKMVIQVNSSDPVTHKLALLDAKNLKRVLGKDSVDIEIVVYGPGLGILSSSSWSADRVHALMEDHNVKFSVCKGSLERYAKRHGGSTADIIEGVSVVSTGALRILELQEQGYAYLRP